MALVDCWTEVRLSTTLGLANMFSLCSLWLNCLFSRRSVCSFVCLFLVFLFHSATEAILLKICEPPLLPVPTGESASPFMPIHLSHSIKGNIFTNAKHALAEKVLCTFGCTSYQFRDHVCTQKKIPMTVQEVYIRLDNSFTFRSIV